MRHAHGGAAPSAPSHGADAPAGRKNPKIHIMFYLIINVDFKDVFDTVQRRNKSISTWSCRETTGPTQRDLNYSGHNKSHRRIFSWREEALLRERLFLVYIDCVLIAEMLSTVFLTINVKSAAINANAKSLMKDYYNDHLVCSHECSSPPEGQWWSVRKEKTELKIHK